MSPSSPRNDNLCLPGEGAAVYVGGVKQTSDVTKDVRFALSLQDAERFYTTPLGERRRDGRRRPGGLGWSTAAFRAVDWWTLDATLATKGKMYKQWLSKQCSGFCGTQRMVAFWDTTRDGKCPDCGQEERASHLNLCSNPERTDLLMQMADELERWLRRHYAHPDIAYWLPRYVKLRGTRRLRDLPGLPRSMRAVAEAQDLIPWKDFMEGKVAREWFLLQGPSLACSPSRLNLAD